jgi:hypothetical protein
VKRSLGIGRIVRDRATRPAFGGVRLPDVTVPTRALSGQRGGGLSCHLTQDDAAEIVDKARRSTVPG